MTDSSRPVAFVTGAGGGIGRAVVGELLLSHDVIAVDLTVDGFGEGAAEGAADAVVPSGRLVALTADVSDLASLAEALRRGEDELGAVSAVVACAGVEVTGTVETVTPELWARAIAINLTGVFHTARIALPSLRATRGSFTAIASDAATHASEDCVAYVASKHGVLGIVRSLALDFGAAGVRSNAVCPGFVETPMTSRIFDSSPPGAEDHYRALVPLGRFAKPGEIASVVRHFVDSSYANGTVYAIDGGATAGYVVGPNLARMTGATA